MAAERNQLSGKHWSSKNDIEIEEQIISPIS